MERKLKRRKSLNKNDGFFVLRVKKKNIKTVPMKVYRTWCAMPYPRHPKGCPNVNYCRRALKKRKPAREVFNLDAPMYLIYSEYDLKAQAARMKKRHPEWSEAQCRNLRYYQNHVDRALNKKCRQFISENKLHGYVAMGEGFGINMYSTCRSLGVKLDKMNNMQTVRKMALILKLQKKQVSKTRNVKWKR